MSEKRLNHLGFESIEARTSQAGILNMNCYAQKGSRNDIPFNDNSHGQATMHRPQWLIRIFVTIGFLLLLMFGFTSSSNAQSGASVSGTVNDGTGAVISGVRVLLKNVDTGVEQSTQTNGSGSYAFISVIPGRYSLECTRDGFATAKEANVSLGVNQAALLNVTLVPGSVQQTVVVSADSSAQQTTNATLGTAIATKSVNDLPLNGRNFTQMLELTPGVSRITVAQNATGGETSNPVGTFTFPSVNGQRNRANMFLLDGSNDLNSYNGAYNYEPIVDGIQEFKVQSHNDLAEFGQVTGGIVNVVTKSGTNEFHGALWKFIRNSALDARNYFASVVNPLRQNQFGATVGGPVRLPHIYNGKDRTFFFFAYEGFRQSQAAQSLLTTPTSAQLGGDFSALLSKGIGPL
jgi:Carboxypeptidase regulatory-like domain